MCPAETVSISGGKPYRIRCWGVTFRCTARHVEEKRSQQHGSVPNVVPLWLLMPIRLQPKIPFSPSEHNRLVGQLRHLLHKCRLTLVLDNPRQAPTAMQAALTSPRPHTAALRLPPHRIGGSPDGLPSWRRPVRLSLHSEQRSPDGGSEWGRSYWTSSSLTSPT